MQLLHGDSRLHLIFRLRHSVHALHCHQSVDVDQYCVLMERVHGGSSPSAYGFGHGERVAGRWGFSKISNVITSSLQPPAGIIRRFLKRSCQKKNLQLMRESQGCQLAVGNCVFSPSGLPFPDSEVPNGREYSQIVSVSRATINKHTSTRVYSFKQAGSSLASNAM